MEQQGLSIDGKRRALLKAMSKSCPDGMVSKVIPFRESDVSGFLARLLEFEKESRNIRFVVD